jgi:hypothetical protein
MTAVFDRRRVPAPETSYTPIPFEQEAGPSRRTDRSADEARPICQYTTDRFYVGADHQSSRPALSHKPMGVVISNLEGSR